MDQQFRSAGVVLTCSHLGNRTAVANEQKDRGLRFQFQTSSGFRLLSSFEADADWQELQGFLARAPVP